MAGIILLFCIITYSFETFARQISFGEHYQHKWGDQLRLQYNSDLIADSTAINKIGALIT